MNLEQEEEPRILQEAASIRPFLVARSQFAGFNRHMVCQHLPIYLKGLQERCQYQCALCCRNGFSKTSSTWCPGNSWLCAVHLPYAKICRPASSLSGKTCKRTRNHEAGGSCQWNILCNGD